MELKNEDIIKRPLVLTEKGNLMRESENKYLFEVDKRADKPAIRRAVERWGLECAWVEKIGFQLSLIQHALAEGLPVRAVHPDKDKVARAIPATASFEGGRLLLPKTASWLGELESELVAFPNGAHDDQVDALAYGVRVTGPMQASGPCTVISGKRSVESATELGERIQRSRRRFEWN